MKHHQISQPLLGYLLSRYKYRSFRVLGSGKGYADRNSRVNKKKNVQGKAIRKTT